MTTESVPLGQPESQQLEFKSRQALENRLVIGRAVVGMLNAEGGDIWIGLAEEAERAVLVEPIEKPQVEKRALEDFLVDTIEPPLTSGEIKIEIVSTPKEEHVLKIRIRPEKNRQPYALLRKTLRDYVVRIGGRLRPMSREEIFERTREAVPLEDERQKALDAAIARVQEAREQVERFSKGTFWLHFKPVDEVSIDIQDPIFDELVLEPSLTENRRSGWHFARASEKPELFPEGVRWTGRRRYREGEAFEVVVRRSGTLTFRAALEFFYRKGEENQLWPPILVEYPTSAFRIARFIYRTWEAGNQQVVVECALLDIEGWGLRSDDPARFDLEPLQQYEEAQDLIWEEPLVFGMDEIQEEPDRCSFRLLRRIYEAFGYRESEIPFFDRDTGRLVLPE